MVHGDVDILSPCESANNVEIMLVSGEQLQLYDLLGAGGFGSVHLGTMDGEIVAVKRTHQRTKTDSAMEESFRAELMAACLCHENIVRVVGVCFDLAYEEGELPLLIMEYAGERNLQMVIDDVREPMPVSRRLRFASDMVRALEFAHSNGFLHLDVKPANVIVSTDDRCKLADFGCSQLCSTQSVSSEPSTPTKSLMTGTFAYRAPELLRGRPATDKADIYSTAICLWQLLTRQRPYEHEEHQVIVFSVVAHDLRPNLPDGLTTTEPVYSQLITDSWHKEPDCRPSAGQVLKLLQLASQQNAIVNG